MSQITHNRKKSGSVIVHLKDLPSQGNIDFRDTAFFTKGERGTELPSPEVVRDHARLTGYNGAGKARTVQFPSLGLLVKFGIDVTLPEGQCLWVIQRLLKGDVPVPGVYGWRRDGREMFLYMELIQGLTLEEQWDSLSAEHRESLCVELRNITSCLRNLEQEPDDCFIGSIGRQPIQDVITDCFPKHGIFKTTKEFHDWFSGLNNRHHPNISEFSDPMRTGLPDDCPITFTHNDLHPSNIIISSESGGTCPSVLAIVDWHQSGWYPEYWEYCKAIYSSDPDGDWANVYVPMFLEEPGCLDHWFYYLSGFGF